MAERVYRLTEIVGTSPDGLDAAIQTGIKRAASTLHGLDWFQVSDIRGQIVDGDVAHYQVTLKVGFRLDEPPSDE
jgi:flavin-binding protein dodecin